MCQYFDKQNNLLESSSTLWNTFNEIKPLSEDRVEISGKYSGAKFYMSVVRPHTADRIQSSPQKKDIFKQVLTQESPLRPIPEPLPKRNSFIIVDRNANLINQRADIKSSELVKKRTFTPFVKEILVKRQRTMIKPTVRADSPIIKKELSIKNYNLVPSDQYTMFLKKAQKIVHSKKLCCVQNKLFTDYQKLINYIP